MGDYWTGDPLGTDVGDVTLVEKDVVVGVGVAVPVEVPSVGVGVWLGVWVTLGADECEGDGDSV
jgi:hypothetical protein